MGSQYGSPRHVIKYAVHISGLTLCDLSEICDVLGVAMCYLRVTFVYFFKTI